MLGHTIIETDFTRRKLSVFFFLQSFINITVNGLLPNPNRTLRRQVGIVRECNSLPSYFESVNCVLFRWWSIFVLVFEAHWAAYTVRCCFDSSEISLE